MVFYVLLANSSADTNSMTDPDIMNDSFVTSYDDADLESNQSSDDDLPDVLSQDSKKSKSGSSLLHRPIFLVSFSPLVEALFPTTKRIVFPATITREKRIFSGG